MRLLATIIVISLLAFFLLLASVIIFQQWWSNRQRRKQKESSLVGEESTPVTKLTVRRGRVVPASRRQNSVGSEKPNWLRRLSKISAYSGPPRSEKSAYPIPDSPLTPRFGVFHLNSRAESLHGGSTAGRAQSIRTNASYDDIPTGGQRSLQVTDGNRSRLSQVREDVSTSAPSKTPKSPLVQVQEIRAESPIQDPHSTHRVSDSFRIPHQGIFSVDCVSHLASHQSNRNSTASVPAGRRGSTAVPSARAKSAEPTHGQPMGHESQQSFRDGKSDVQRLITASPAAMSSSNGTIAEIDPFDLAAPSPVFFPGDKHISAPHDYAPPTRPTLDARNASGISAYELMGPFGSSAADYRPSPNNSALGRPLHISEMTFLQSASSESENPSNYNNSINNDDSQGLSKMRVPLSAFNTVFRQQPSHHQQQPMELSSGLRRARSVISAKSFASLTSADGSSSVLTVAQELPMPMREQVQARRKEKNLPPLPALESIISQPKVMQSSFSRPAKAQDLQRMRAAVKSEAWVV